MEITPEQYEKIAANALRAVAIYPARDTFGHAQRAKTVTYRGRRALRLTEEPAEPGQLLAILHSRPFHDGTIDIDVAGARSATAAETDLGFIGITFRMQPDNAL